MEPIGQEGEARLARARAGLERVVVAVVAGALLVSVAAHSRWEWPRVLAVCALTAALVRTIRGARRA